MPKYRIEITNRQDRVPVDEASLREGLEHVLSRESEAEEVLLTVAVVGEQETRAVNRSFLDREGTTDVISFPYHSCDDYVEGEIVLNADEALRQAEKTDHEAWDEVLLYAVHGTLHLVGYDDNTPETRDRMNRRALELLSETGRTLDATTLLEE